MHQILKLFLITAIILPGLAYAKEPYKKFCYELNPIGSVWDYKYEEILKSKDYLTKKEARRKTSVPENICLAKVLYMEHMYAESPLSSALDNSNRILADVFAQEPGNHFAHAQLSFNSMAILDYNQAEELYDTAKNGLVPKELIQILELKIQSGKGECAWITKHAGRLSKKGTNTVMGVSLSALADCANQKGNIEMVARYLRGKTLRLPSYITFVEYSHANSQLGRWDFAVKAAENALSRRAWQGGYEALSWALIGKGSNIIETTDNYSIALTYLDYGYKYDPLNVSGIIKIAEAYTILTEKSIGVESTFKPYKKSAVFYAKKALELDPSNPTANKIFRELAAMRM